MCWACQEGERERMWALIDVISLGQMPAGHTAEDLREMGLPLPGERYDEDVIEATHTFTARKAQEDLDEALRERFLEDTKMSASDWEHVRDRVIVVHEAPRTCGFGAELITLITERCFTLLEAPPARVWTSSRTDRTGIERT